LSGWYLFLGNKEYVKINVLGKFQKRLTKDPRDIINKSIAEHIVD
jgi:hypothetical protein